MQAELPRETPSVSDAELDQVTSDTPADVVPTELSLLDHSLGIGGIKLGRMYEIYGPPMSGKTALCLTVARAVQDRSRPVAYIDGDRTIETSRLGELGLDPAE